MRSQVVCRAQAVALDAACAGLDDLLAAGLEAVDPADAVVLLGEVEALGRRVDAIRAGVVEAIGRRGFHRADGHASAKVMARHVGRLAKREATRRDRAARAVRAMPLLGAAWAAGEVGTDQVGVLARAWANTRVRAALEDQIDVFLEHAKVLSHEDFARLVAAWESYVDEDGAGDGAERSHASRDARLVQLFDGSWELIARFGSLQGAELDAVFAAYRRAEWAADWDEAKAAKGDAATPQDLRRTEAQRRADALVRVFADAADAHAASEGGARIVTDIVIDQATFERLLRKMAGARVPPRDPTVEPPPSGPSPGAPAGRGERVRGDEADRADTWSGDTPPAGAGPPGHQHGDENVAVSGDGVGGDPGRWEGPGGNGRDGGSDRVEDHDRVGHDSADDDGDQDDDGWAEPPGDFAHFRCSTLDGHPIDPAEAVAAALVGHVRRAVVGAAGVTIDLGRRRRLFTGPAQLAARLAATTCFWPGCHVPVTNCTTDHLLAWDDGGPTDQTNGAPACDRHNRYKDVGRYQVRRDPDGRIHVTRPDGTEIE